MVMSAPRRRIAGMKWFIVAVLCLVPLAPVYGGNQIALYRIGDEGQAAWSLLRDRLEAKGFGATVYQGEVMIDKHVEKVNRINRSGANVFLAVELFRGEKTRVMVAEPDVKKGEGRFLTIDEIPGEFAAESKRLAASLASPFGAKVRRLPLFPLLGVHMPGALVRIEFKEEETLEVVNKLCNGVERYFSERTKR